MRGSARRLLATAVVSAAAVGLGACSDDPEPGAPQGEPVLEVEADTCLLVEATLGSSVTELPVVPCEVSHTHEIFAKVADTVDDVYPGMSALVAFAEAECYTRFEDYVGISPFDSDLFVDWIVPSLDGWNDEDDREVLCVLGRRDGAPLTVPARDSKL